MMSLPDHAADSHNPFAPPSVHSSMPAEPQQWGWQHVVGLLFVGFVFQVVLSTLTIHFLLSRVLGFIKTPFLHLFVTVAVTLFVTGLLLRGCQFFTAVIASQVMNLVQWSTFVAIAIYLDRIDFTPVRLSSAGKKLFFGIYLCVAAVIAIVCWLVRRRRRGRVAEVMVPGLTQDTRSTRTPEPRGRERVHASFAVAFAFNGPFFVDLTVPA